MEISMEYQAGDFVLLIEKGYKTSAYERICVVEDSLAMTELDEKLQGTYVPIKNINTVDNSIWMKEGKIKQKISRDTAKLLIDELIKSDCFYYKQTRHPRFRKRIEQGEKAINLVNSVLKKE